MANIKDVARVAGVSISTVSHVINGTRFVSEELKGRVTAAMDELGYRPSALARSLRVGQTKTIGLIIPDNSNLFFAEVARHIEDMGYSHGYSVILCNSDNSLEKQHSYVEALLAKQVDGIVFISAGDSTRDLQDLTSAGVPVVVADREVPQSLADMVLVDNELGGCLAARYLIDLGHSRIACIAGPYELTPSAQRVHGYRRALAEAGRCAQDVYLVHGDFSPQSGEAAMLDLLDLPEPPTAVIACNDMMAIGAIRAVHNRGLSVPGTVSIVGFDNIPLAAAIIPALTTVAQPIAELAHLTMELLLGRLRQGEANGTRRRQVLRPELVIRDSCRASG